MDDKDGNPVSFQLGDMLNPRRINQSIALTNDQFAQLSKGVMAHGQDNRWIVFCRGNEFYFHRSWTGQRIYQVSFSNLSSEGQITDAYSCRFFFVESNTEIFAVPESDDEVTRGFQELINSLIRSA